MTSDYRGEVRRLYDTISEEFDRTRVRPDPFLEKLVDRGFSREAGLTLDNGCGNCRNLKALRGRTMVAGDFSRNMLKQCVKNASGKEVHYVQYELTHLPFRNRVFDSIICISAIHHLRENDAEKALREMRRVLSDKGWMLASSWSIKTTRDRKFLRRARRIGGNYFMVNWGQHRRFYFLIDGKTFSKMCNKAGFRDAITLEYGMNNYSLVDRRTREAGAHGEASTDKNDR
ncbi:MAG: class I SAM-dependent methyltransferase [Candidatus Brockarchaeota archaeon]|nr:class I SAM-dependent methyltransferase [Candidatus Brockarchaeota archaeon]